MEMECRCGVAAVLRTSWTERNPGRRYAVCERYRLANGCDFWYWIDPPAGERARQIIPGLLRRVNNLQADLRRRDNNEDENFRRRDNHEDENIRLTLLEEELGRVKKREKWIWVVVVMFLVFYFLKG